MNKSETEERKVFFSRWRRQRAKKKKFSAFKFFMKRKERKSLRRLLQPGEQKEDTEKKSTQKSFLFCSEFEIII